jgi:hypothetical protein
MIDDEILRLHEAGFVTGAIAIRLGVESSHVRSVVRTHLKTAAEASKPHYNAKSEAKRKALAKRDKAQRTLQAAAAELEALEG